jgi:hypothetical protein
VSPTVITALIAATILGVELPLLFRRQGRRTPNGIAKRLQEPGDSHTVVMRWWDAPALWNPERPPGPSNMDFGGPGRAVYQMLPDGNVELRWTPHWGSPRVMVGPVPDSIRKPFASGEARQVIGLIGGAYLACVVGGFVIGWETGAPDNRTDTALGGALLGFVAGWALLVVGSWFVKAILRRRSSRS